MKTSTRHSIMLEPGASPDQRIINAVRQIGIRNTATLCGISHTVISQWTTGQIYLPERTCQIICEAAVCIEQWRKMQ